MLILLVPNNTSTGAWTELGYALGIGKPIIISGNAERSIFADLAFKKFENDEETLKFLLSK